MVALVDSGLSLCVESLPEPEETVALSETGVEGWAVCFLMLLLERRKESGVR